MSRYRHNENHSASPFYDLEFAQQHREKGHLVSRGETLCSACHMPPPAEWCWSHDPTCPLHMPLRGAAAITLRCEFGMLGVPPKPGTMTFHPGSNFAMFVSDDHTTRTHIRLDLLQASFSQ